MIRISGHMNFIKFAQVIQCAQQNQEPNLRSEDLKNKEV